MRKHLQKLALLLMIVMSGSMMAQIVNQPQAVSVLGQENFTSGGSGLNASKLNGPNGVAVDPVSGKVFIADRSNHRVLRYGSTEAMQTGAEAEAVLGQTDFTSNSSGLTAAKFNNPIGLHIDLAGRLWVADFGNRRVLRFDNAAMLSNGAAADAVLGQPDFTTNSNGNSAEKLGGPVGIYVDYTGTLWVSDWSNHRVVWYQNAATLANGSPANGVLGQPGFGSAVGATTQTGMKNPNDVYVDYAGRLWVSDAANRRVLRFDNARNLPNGAPAVGVLGQTDFTSDVSSVSQSGFTNLRFVTGDMKGRLYVIQENSHRITIFENAAALPNGAPADYLWGQPDFNTGTAGNPPTAANFNTPRAMFVDEARETVWVADYNNHRVLRFSVDYFNTLLISNNPQAVSVVGQENFTSGSSGLSASKLNGPNGVAVDPVSGKVFVADRSNHRVLRYSSAAAMQSGAEAEAVLGQTDFTSNSSGLTASKFNNPIGVHLDLLGRLWVADFGNRRMLRFDAAASLPNGAPADAVLGQPDFTTNSAGNTAEKLGGPVGIYVDHTGTLWVSDWSNHRVVWYHNAALLPNGAPADGVLGQPGFGSAVGATTQTGMKNPNDLYVDLFGRLWVSDAANRRVLRFDNARNLPNGAPADGVLGQLDFTSDVSSVSQSGFTNLRFVTGDNSGRIYVMQENSHRIVVFENAASLPNGAPADYIWGQPDFNTGTAGTPPSASNFNTPRAMFLDEATGNVFVADYNNHRVLRFYFLTSGQYQVVLTAPSGGESWAQGTTQTISWTSQMVDHIKIEFSADNGASWTTLAESVPAADGQFAWLVNAPLTNEARIRISDVTNASINSVSGTFSIVPLNVTISLLSPNGYQQWEKGSQKKIMFEATNASNVNIELSTNNGASWTGIVENHSAASGFYLWQLPETTAAQCLIRISDPLTGYQVSSAAPFSIVEPRPENQDIVFFSDSPTADFYDPSWGTFTAPSALELVNGSKWPVSTTYSLVGNYALKLNYTSAPGGNWSIAVASIGWVGHDFMLTDTISIKVFAPSGWTTAQMPFIFLEDLSNRKTEKFPLANYTASVPPLTWTEIRVPVQPFKDNPLQADLTRIKTIFFSQNNADNTPTVLYFDDIRVEGQSINGNDRPVFVVLGSSTAAGTGASSAANSWVGKFRTYVQNIDPDAVVVNLAVGGFTTYHVMPTGFVPPAGRPSPSPNNNITRAMAYNPWAIIINLPSNDAANNYTVEEQMSNFAAILAPAIAQNKHFRLTTTQPRNFSNPAQLQNLINVRTAILNTYGNNAVNIFDELANPDGTIKPMYNSGDGIHLNDAGHNYIYQQIVASGIANILGVDEKAYNGKNNIILGRTYPNPAGELINIPITLDKDAQIELQLFNAQGQLVTTVLSGWQQAGRQTVRFSTSGMPSGLYMLRLKTVAGDKSRVETHTVIVR
ncbi:MAG: T9SS type A sorting domain-containing protein [Bacteroidetes bacterium]|nr:T9SS type A sorting domain-containing protein [Bacteroidota bacterium]